MLQLISDRYNLEKKIGTVWGLLEEAMVVTTSHSLHKNGKFYKDIQSKRSEAGGPKRSQVIDENSKERET